MKPLAPRDALALVLGPAWSQNTPHTAEEASVILGATEPRHALRERLASRKAAASGRVVLEPSPRVTPGEPMPEATMPRAQWRATWRDAEVPPLCALRERCEASACVPVLTLADGMERGDGPWARTSGRWHEARGSEGHTVEEILDCGGSRNARLWKTPGALHLPIDAEGRSYASGTRAMLRAAPMIAERGWCPAISLDLPTATTPVDPATAERTWQAMRAACPERVYPEPGA